MFRNRKKTMDDKVPRCRLGRWASPQLPTWSAMVRVAHDGPGGRVVQKMGSRMVQRHFGRCSSTFFLFSSKL